MSVRDGDPRSVVGDRQHRAVADLAERNGDSAGGEARRVVEQIADRPHQLSRISDNLRRRHARQIESWGGSGAKPGRLAEDDVVQIDGHSPHQSAAIVEPGQFQQIIDEPFEFNRIVEHRLMRFDHPELPSPRSVDLQPGPHSGQRAAQFMGGIGDEPLLELSRGIEPIEHSVHRGGQAGDLVVPGRGWHAPVELRPIDRISLSPDDFDGSQRSPDQGVDQPSKEQGHNRDAELETVNQHPAGLPDVIGQAGDAQYPGAVDGCHRSGCHRVLAVINGDRRPRRGKCRGPHAGTYR